MSSLRIGRLLIGPPMQFYEQAGAPVQGVGGAVVAAPRIPPANTVSVATIAADGQTDTLAARLTIRRQLRSLLNNTPVKTGAFLYVVYSDDPEQNGWYVPDQTTLQDLAGSIGLATGFWQTQGGAWYPVGRQSTHREARQVWMRDLRTGLWARDTLGWIYSTDFAALPAVALSVLPNGANGVADAVTGQAYPLLSQSAGRDGGQCSAVEGLADLAVVSYERAEQDLNLSDVIVKDWRGRTVLNRVADPSFEYDPPGSAPGGAWTPVGAATLTVLATGAFVGVRCCEVQSTATGQGLATTPVSQLNVYDVWTAGVPFVAQTYLKGAAGGEKVTVVFGNGADIASASFTLTSQWALYDVAWTPASTHTTATLTIESAQSDAQTFYADGVLVVEGSAPVAYADGDQAGCDWQGTFGSSVTIAAGEECYGTVWPWSWLTAPNTPDMPVLDNGLIRVRFDAGIDMPVGYNITGFRVDAWGGQPGGGAAGYYEQGKVTAARFGDYNGALLDKFVSASLVEWTPERAVVAVVLASSVDAAAHDRLFITVARGQPLAKFECYPAPKLDGANASTTLIWTPAQADSNDSIFKCDSQTQPPPAGHAVIAATAGTGSSLFGGSGGVLGAATFAASENWVALLRCPSAYATLDAFQVNLLVGQAGAALDYSTLDTSGYGTGRNSFQVAAPSGAGYAVTLVGFASAGSQQVMEAESLTLLPGTSVTADATASGGHAATATRTTDSGAHVSVANWPNNDIQSCRLFMRVRVSAGTASFYVTLGVATTVTVTTTSTSYVWLDLGELTSLGELQVHAWLSSGAGTVYVDRIEAPMTQSSAGAPSGARDMGQAALMDSRMIGSLVAR